jgi:hypothetical protein
MKNKANSTSKKLTLKVKTQLQAGAFLGITLSTGLGQPAQGQK